MSNGEIGEAEGHDPLAGGTHKIGLDNMTPTTSSHQTTHLALRLGAFLRKGPAYLCTYGQWRLKRWGQKILPPRLPLDDATFFAQLDLGRPGLAAVREEVVRADYETARARLLLHFCSRTSPKFHFTWEDREGIIGAISVKHKEATLRAAEEICQLVFRFRQLPAVRFKEKVDWIHCPERNTDWTWDLNRHHCFLTLGRAYWYSGDEKYARKFTELLLDWLARNPCHVDETNWKNVLEVAIRINTWIWAFYYFNVSDYFNQQGHIELLKGLLLHARYLAANLEYHACNNHLLLEAKALALCGLLFPEFREAKSWRELGLNILWEQVDRQVCEDGVHGERSPLYHWLIASELLEMIVLLENNNLHIPARIWDRIERMLDFQFAITKPDGSLPLFGDSALTDTHARFSTLWGGVALFNRTEFGIALKRLDEETAWLLGRDRLAKLSSRPDTKPGYTSRAFPQGGYFVMRTGWDRKASYLAFDCGPFGYPSLPVHGHADALSFELYAYGHTLVTDCGAYSYHVEDNWRNYFRGTRAHNTIVVDGQDQSVLVGRRDIGRMAQSTLYEWFSNFHFDFVDGMHDGYCRLSQAVTHRRKVFFVKPEYWVIIDLLEGQGEHRLELNFHLMPQTRFALDPVSKALYSRNEKSANIAIIPLHPEGLQAEVCTGALEPIQGWVSFYSGEKLPAPVLCYSKRAHMPTTFQNILYPYPPGELPDLDVTPLEITSDNQELAAEPATTGLRLETNAYVDYLVIVHDGVPCRIAFDSYESDAEIIYIRQPKGSQSFRKILLKRGRVLFFQEKPLVRAQALLQNLVLVRQNAELQIMSSCETALQIQAPDIKKVLLNGREAAFSYQESYIYLQAIS